MGIVGRVEVFEVGDGFLFAAGWLGPDLAGTGRPVPDLVASAGSAELGRAALTALGRRDDLPEGAQSFHAVLRTAGRVAAFPTLAAWSGGRTVPLEAVPPRPFVPRGHLDRADGDAVEGWLFDPGAALAGERPVLVVDGRQAAALELDQPRPDLPFPAPVAGGYGFHLRLAHLARLLAGSDPGFAPLDGYPHGLALVSSGQAVAYAVLQASSAATGRLERVAAGVLVGWVADRPGPEGQPPAAEVLLDGVRYWTASATEMRPDLPSAGPGQVARGLRVALPNPLPDEGAGRVTLRIPGTGVDLPGAAALDTPTIRPDLGRVLETLPEPGSPGISVVVPVHDAPLPLEACLEALAQHTTCPARLLLLDDASADPRVAEILARWAARPGVAVHRNATNLGFAGTCNRGFALAGRDDVVLLNADTEVGPGWLEGLRLAAYASRATGTATAVSDHAGPFSVPEPYLRNARPPGFAAADLARLVRQASPALLPVVPTGHGFCLYLRRDCLDQVGGFDAAAFPRGYGEENDFCLRAGRAGWVHRVDDRTWVRHHGGTSFGTARAALQEAGQAVLEARYPEYPHLTATLDDDPGLLALRWRVRRALGAARGAPRPRVLFVLATRTGGTPQTNRDLMAALADRYEPWTLHSDGRELELAGQDGTVVERRRLPRPLTPAIHASPEYDAAVADLLVRHGFELVHVRHLAWHGLGLTAACRRLGVPVVFSFHDFYAVCPTVKLLDEKAVFCGGACTPTPGDCTAELWPPEAVPPLKHRFVHRWKAMMAAALRPCDAFVTTSPRAQATLLDNFPFLARRDFRVIPHGRDFARFGRPVEPPVDRERLRVLVPGNISAAKGAGLVAAMAALDGGEAVEFHVLGDPGTIPAGPGTVLHGRYDRAAFAARARRIRPHLGTVLSLWPETWCHTLTELWASGLPVLALDTGAPGERLRAHGGGWLLPADAAPQQLLDALLRLRRNPEEVRARTAQVLAWQRGEGRYYGTAAMAVEYDLLYRAVLARRRAFADPRAVVPPPSGPRGVPPSPQPA